MQGGTQEGRDAVIQGQRLSGKEASRLPFTEIGRHRGRQVGR